MKAGQEQKAIVVEETHLEHFRLCARLCEFKKCCKKYKHGKRCKKCPKKD